MSLVFCIFWTDSYSSFLRLLSTSTSPLSTFDIPVTLYGLLETPGNLELRKRKGVAGLTFHNVGLAGLMGDIDTDLARDAARNNALCAGIFWEVSEGT